MDTNFIKRTFWCIIFTLICTLGFHYNIYIGQTVAIAGFIIAWGLGRK